MNVLVDAKNEYTINIINILTPLILEGLNSIYGKAKEISTGENVLKIFQSFLKRIPKWTSELLDSEVNRIKTSSRNYDLLYDLIRASMKANLHILMFNPFQTNKPKINPEHYKNIDFKKFIHNIYIETAREIWNNPYLFYHNYAPIEIKRNQRDTLDLIKKCIEETIRKTLPLKHVLEIYLGDDMINPIPDDNFEKTITEVDERNLSLLLKKELGPRVPQQLINQDPSFIPKEITPKKSSDQITIDKNLDFIEKSQINTQGNSDSNSTRKSTRSSSSSTRKQTGSLVQSQRGGNKSSSDKGINSKILSILNDNELKLSEDNNVTSENKIEKKKLSETSSDDLITSNMDSNLKKILKNDLGNTETESSVQFKPENNSSKYQEIFSNSNMDEKSANSQEKNDENNKNKFFNNYLQF
jgi:hypothetical protein